MFEIGPLRLVGMTQRRPGFGLKGAKFHVVDLLHLLEDLVAFMGKCVHWV